MSSVTGEIGYKIGTPANALPWIGGKVINAPPNAIALTLNGAAGMSALSILEGVTTAGTGTTFAASIVTGNAGANHGNGLYVQSGASASDAAISVTTAAGTGTLLQIFGDNHGKIGNGLVWSTGGQYNFAQPVSGATVCLIVNGAASNYTMSIQGNTTAGASFGLELFAGSNANDVALLINSATQAAQIMRIRGDSSGYLGPSATVGVQWDANGGWTFAGTGAAQIVVGTSTAYAWGTGTKYPTVQLAGVGAIFGTATTGIVLTGGGLYYSGTHYVYGQGGTGVVASLGTGTFSIAISTAGTAAQVADPVTIVKVDSLGMVIGTMTNTTAGGFNAPAIFANGTQITGAGASVANPTAKVSTTATNGVSASAMRADGAPAIDSAMTPTWTGTHVFSPAANTPITVTGTMTNGTGIFVNMTSSGTGQQIQGIVVVNTIGSNNNLWVTIKNTSVSGANVAGLSLVGGTSTFNSTDFELYQQGDQVAVLFNGAAKPMDFFVGGVNVLQLNTATSPVIRGYGPTAVGLVDMTPDTGTFTISYLNGTGTPTGTAKWAKMGNVVVLIFPGVNAMASNSTTFTASGLPAEIQPASFQIVAAPGGVIEDTGALLEGSEAVQFNASSGTINFLKNGSTTGWTATGNKYVTATFSVTYCLN